jgi:hypothetical protein
MGEHALLSASAASRWIACPGSVALNIDKPDTSSAAADEGTLAHSLAAAMLLDESANSWPTSNPEMLKQVEKYVTVVKEICRAVNGTLLVEQRVSMEAYVPGCWGTADAIILAADEIIVIDLKYGSNPRNLVVAEGNPQLRLYALGAYWEVGEMFGASKVRTMIIQPRLDSITEEAMSVEQLLAWGEETKAAAELALSMLNKYTPAYYTPGPKQCQWCKAKLDCPAMIAIVKDETGADPFDDISEPAVPPADRIGKAMSNVDLIEDWCRAVNGTLLVEQRVSMEAYVPGCWGTADAIILAADELIEDWCRAVRAEVERRLINGEPVEGYKLVEGRKGARAWTDAAAAEQLMKEKFRLTIDEMYDKKLISPTSAEKVLKESPKRWEQVKALIHSPQGKPSVAPESDKRPALKVADGSEFEALDQEVA